MFNCCLARNEKSISLAALTLTDVVAGWPKMFLRSDSIGTFVAVNQRPSPATFEARLIEGRTVFIKRNAQRVQRTLGGTRVLVKDPKHRYKNRRRSNQLLTQPAGGLEYFSGDPSAIR